jgi:tetratricopeptide (TPR) repeat protein
MKKIFLISFFSLMISIADSQTREKDSLKNLLSNKMQDTSRAMALVQLSFFEQNIDSALKLDEESLALSKKINFRRGEAASLHQFSNDFLARSNYPKALECVLQSLQINESIGDMTSLARNYGNIGKIYSSQKDYTKALSYLYKSIEIFKKSGNEKVRITYVSIGEIYEKLNQLDSALDYYQRSYMIFNSINDKYQLSFVLNALGNVHSKMGHTDLAFAFYRMSIGDSVTRSQYLPESYYGLANMFKQTGKIDSCFYYAKKAMDASTGYPEMVVKSSM